MDNKDIFTEYSAEIDDLLLSVFIAKNGDAGEKITDGRYPQVLHSHSFVELFVCTSASLTVISDFGTVTLGKDDIAIVPANRLHATYCDNNLPFAIGIRGLKIPKRRGGSFAEFSDLLTTEYARVYRGMRGIREVALSLASDSFSGGSSIPVIKTAALLADLVRYGECETLGVTPMNSDTAKLGDIKPILYIEEVINSSYCEPLNVEDIAAELYISRRHLDRMVRRHYGRTLVEMVNEKRIKMSKQVLRETNLKLENVSRAVGFSSVASFRKAFMKAVGKSPSQYRKDRC